MKIAPALRIARRERFGVVGHDFEMFGRQPVDERDGVFEIGRRDNGAEIRQNAPAISPRGKVASWLATAFSTVGESALSVIRIDCAAASCSAWARRSAAIQSGLAVVGEDQNFRRAGDHVDADLAEDAALGGCDKGVAGTDDLGDRSDGPGAIGERGDRLRAADAVDLVDAGERAAARTSGLSGRRGSARP